MTAAAAEPITAAQLTIVPANHASWADLQAIFGVADDPGRCCSSCTAACRSIS